MSCMMLVAVALALVAAGPAQDDLQGAQPAPEPARLFDEKAYPEQDIDAALAVARKENHRVLVVWGANWCRWCRMFQALSTSDPKVKRELLSEYEVVHVDVGRLDKNLDLASNYGVDIAGGAGIPYLTILDVEGTVLTSQGTTSLELRGRRRKGHDPAKVLDLLVQHQAPYPPAELVLSAAVARAKAQEKRVFLYFSAPGSAAGRELQTWIESASVATLLAKDLVITKVDVQRTVGGKDLLSGLRKDGEKSLPWFAVLDIDGNPLATSEGEDGKNIQFPSDPFEITHFQDMLRKSAKRLGEADVKVLGSALTEMCEEAPKDSVDPAGG